MSDAGRMLVVVAVAGALAGCGSAVVPAPSPAATGVPPPPNSALATAQPKCVAGDVSVALAEFGQGSGDATANIVVTNTGRRTCSIDGYGGVGLISGGDGRPIESSLTREPTPAPVLVTLAPGAKAVKSLYWRLVAGADEPQPGPNGLPPCGPIVGFITVILPDDTVPMEIDVTGPIKNSPNDHGDLGAVCEHGRLRGAAYQPA